MVLLQLVKDRVKYIKQNMFDKNTGMTQGAQFPMCIWELNV